MVALEDLDSSDERPIGGRQNRDSACVLENRDLMHSHSPSAKPGLGEDRRWLTILGILVGIELAWWAIAWKAEVAPAPLLATYVVLAFAGLLFALTVRKLLRNSSELASWPSTVGGTVLIAVGASIFLPLKHAIPSEVPFWMDAPIAQAERALFTADPWLLIDKFLGWAVVPMDRLYGLWLPVQSIVLFSVILQPASLAKSRALIAYSLAWFLLGVVAAVMLSSAGPIFYDRLLGGSQFAPLNEMLRARGAWVVLAESDAMWESLASGRPGIVSGISAAPSIHVAISLWMVLTARIMARKLVPFAATYFACIWLGSVQLGWHYVSDGLIGATGMLAIWALAGATGSVTSAFRPKRTFAVEVRFSRQADSVVKIPATADKTRPMIDWVERS